MKKLVLLAMSLYAAVAFGQQGQKPVLMFDSSLNPFPAGAGTPLPYSPERVICYTNTTGQILPCNFSAGGGDTITSPNSTISVGGTVNNTTLDINLATANTWIPLQSFTGGLKIGSGANAYQTLTGAGTFQFVNSTSTAGFGILPGSITSFSLSGVSPSSTAADYVASIGSAGVPIATGGEKIETTSANFLSAANTLEWQTLIQVGTGSIPIVMGQGDVTTTIKNTNLAFQGLSSFITGGIASTAGFFVSGTPFTGGTGTTTWPQVFVCPSATASTITTFQTGGTALGVCLPSGSTGDLFTGFTGAANKFRISNTGAAIGLSYGGTISANDGVFTPGTASTASSINRNQADAFGALSLAIQNASSTGVTLTTSNSGSGDQADFGANAKVLNGGGAIHPTYGTTTNCSSSASPAVCGSAASGSGAIPTGTISETLTVNTTAVTANSQILLTPDSSLGTKLGVTCDSTLAELVGGLTVTARTAATSFVVTHSGNITTNPLCFSYTIVN